MANQYYCEFAPHLYLSDGINNLSKIKRKLTHGAGQLTIYVICRAPETENQIAVMHCANLKQSWYKTHPVYVYGIASGYEASRALLVRICDDAAREGFDDRLSEFLDLRTGGTP